jgi:hypothetical protein
VVGCYDKSLSRREAEVRTDTLKTRMSDLSQSFTVGIQNVSKVGFYAVELLANAFNELGYNDSTLYRHHSKGALELICCSEVGDDAPITFPVYVQPWKHEY